MLATKKFWNNLSDVGWRKMAEDWLIANLESREEVSKVDLAVVDMKFSHVPEKLWNFILLTSSLAETEWQLGQIGAGLIEHLLGWYGDNYIQLAEEQAAINENFSQALLIVNKYKMTDEIWKKVLILQDQIRSKQLPIINSK